MLSRNEQDYLRVVYELQAKSGGGVRASSVASGLGVSKASVSQMLGRLEQKGLVWRKKSYGLVSLSLEGVREARKVVRRHRLLEVFLSDWLGLKAFHGEAHALEHSVSDEAEERLYCLLKRPAKCPDGGEIPAAGRSVISLANAPPGKVVKIVFSSLESKEELALVKSLGLVCGERVKVLRRISGGPLVVSVKGSQLALGRSVAGSVFVEVSA